MPDKSSGTIELERELLAALCAAGNSFSGRESVMRTLADYTWQSADHRIIFEALRRCGPRRIDETREFLAAEVTRLGFPDIDLAQYFVSVPARSSHIERLLNALLNPAQ